MCKLSRKLTPYHSCFRKHIPHRTKEELFLIRANYECNWDNYSVKTNPFVHLVLSWWLSFLTRRFSIFDATKKKTLNKKISLWLDITAILEVAFLVGHVNVEYFSIFLGPKMTSEFILMLFVLPFGFLLVEAVTTERLFLKKAGQHTN